MRKLFYLLFALLVMISCENEVFITMPQGPQGEQGQSAFDIWKEYFNKPDATIEEYFTFFKGEDGKDGLTPYIGENGNWYLGDLDTGVPARGKDGADGITPHIGDNGNWFIGTTDTKVPAQGKDGIDGEDGTTPRIGENGNWWIGDWDSNVPARGPKGDTGQNGKDGLTPYIKDGYWWIGGKNTGVPARGEDGKDGVCNDCCEDLTFTVLLSGDCVGTPDSWGQPGQPGSPGWDYNPVTNPRAAYLVTFYVEISGFTPNATVRLQAFNGEYYTEVFTSTTDGNGYLKKYISATQLQAKAAIEHEVIFVNDYKLKFTHPF